MALVSLRGPTGWTIFAFIWSLALIGVVLKLFYTGRFRVASTIMYVLMGWILLLAIKPLAASLTPAGLYWLIAGGVAYTVGALLYSIQQLGYNHAIFHIFVLAGSIAHFIMIYFYVIPTT
jgi:hemolysin III